MGSVTEHFDGIPTVKNLSNKLGVPSGYLVIAVIFFSGFLVFSDFGSHLICDVIGIIYPSYMSFKAIESAGAEDDKLWLTYWVVFACVRCAETFFDFILFWLPFYHLGKLFFLIYLAFPTTQGAVVLYNTVIKPILKLEEAKIDAALHNIKENAEQVKNQAESAAKTAVAENAGSIISGVSEVMSDKKNE